MTALPIYYINLDSQVSRRQAMEEQLAALRLKAHRIEAVTRHQVPEQYLARYCDPRRYLWQTPVELACSLSHLAALRSFLATGAPYGVIFEDDVLISAELPVFLENVEAASPKVDLIKLETFNDEMMVEPVPTMRLGMVALTRVFSRTNGAAGYLVSRSAASLIESGENMLVTQADTALFNPHFFLPRKLLVLHANPGLCIQKHRLTTSDLDSRDSQITGARADRRGIARQYRIHRDLRRLRELLERGHWRWSEYVWAARAKAIRRRITFLS